MQEKVSIREFSRIMGYTDSAVNKWIKAGKIEASSIDYTDPKRPKIDVEKAKANLQLHWKPSHAYNADPEKRYKTRHNRDERPEAAKEAKRLQPSGAVELPEEYLNKTISEIQKLQAIKKLELMEVELGVANKTLVKKEDVYAALYKTGQEIRDSFQAVPDRIVDDIMLAKNRDEVYDIIFKEIHAVLTSLADADREL